MCKDYRLTFFDGHSLIISAKSISEAIEIASEKDDVDFLLSIYPIDLKTFQ